MRQPEKPVRVFELDALRGLALFMMILHHIAFDIRYLFSLDVFAFQETWWFNHLLQPLFLNVFIIVSGICCTFSRNNTRRGLRMLAASLGLTAVSVAGSLISGQEYYIFFNVLHLLAAGTLLVSALTRPERALAGPEQARAGPERARVGLERAREIKPARTDVTMIFLMAVLIWLSSLLPHWQGFGGGWLLPLGILPESFVQMADYLPLIPWLGFFLLGAVVGRLVYANRQSAFPGAPAWLLQASRPFGFLGRHSLLVYLLHQPLIIALLYGLRALHVI